MKKLIVTKKYDNKKLSKFITDSFPHLSINTLYKAFRQKDVKVNNSRINKDCIICSGDEIVIFISDNLLFPSMDLKVVFEERW